MITKLLYRKKKDSKFTGSTKNKKDMIDIKIVLGILLIHWVADFLCQTDYMAQNKSRTMNALLLHTVVYTAVWIAPTVMIIGQNAGWFLLVTLIAHTVQDYITSRINSKLWADKKVHWFFVSIGFDQLLHYTQLIGTYYLLTK